MAKSSQHSRRQGCVCPGAYLISLSSQKAADELGCSAPLRANSRHRLSSNYQCSSTSEIAVSYAVSSVAGASTADVVPAFQIRWKSDDIRCLETAPVTSTTSTAPITSATSTSTDIPTPPPSNQ